MKLPFSRAKESPVATQTLAYYGGRAQYRVTDVEAYAREGYMANPDVYSAIEVKANAAGSVEWGVEKRVRGAWEPLDTHPMLDLWMQPNPRMGNTQLVRSLVKWRCIGGEFYLARNEKPSGPPKELWVLPVPRMKIVPSLAPGDPIAYFEYEVGGKKQRLESTDVLHLPMFHPLDDFYGLAPLEAVARMIDQANSAADFNLALLQNGGIPPGFLSTDGEVSDKTFDRLKASMNKWGVGKRSGKPELLEGGLKWQDAARTPADMQMLEAQRMFALKFAQVIGVPAEFLSGAEEKKYANYGEAQKALYTVGVLPELDDIRDGANGFLQQWFGADVRLVYKRESIDALQEDEAKVWARADASDDLTIDESRALKGYEPLPGGAGDVLLVPFSVAPLGMVVDSGGEGEPPADSDPGNDDDGDEPDPDGGPGSKALNLPDARKAAYWKIIDSKRQRLESVVTEAMRRQLEADNTAVVKAMLTAPTPPAMESRMERAVDAQAAAWRKLIEDTYLKVGEPFADDVLADLEKQAGPDHLKVGVEALPDAWMGLVKDYLKENGAVRVKHILDTTKKTVSSEIQAGIDEWEGIPEIAKRVQDKIEGSTPTRARTIARTETVSASNAASMAAASSTGLPLEKEWIETADDRTRDSHIGVEPVGLDEAFTLGSGDQLQFPGDGSEGADAGEIVNCRCTQAYRVKE